MEAGPPAGIRLTVRSKANSRDSPSEVRLAVSVHLTHTPTLVLPASVSNSRRCHCRADALLSRTSMSKC